MYSYLKGILISKALPRIVVENSGIGYELVVGEKTYCDLPAVENDVMLYVYHYIKEDREDLYGFKTETEKKFFELLLSVSNIGPGKAIGILSQINPADFSKAVMREDVAKLSSVKGIGKKTAQRLMVEMKDRIDEFSGYDEGTVEERNKADEAVCGLVSLGFRETEAKGLVERALQEIEEPVSTEEIIKRALKKHE